MEQRVFPPQTRTQTRTEGSSKGGGTHRVAEVVEVVGDGGVNVKLIGARGVLPCMQQITKQDSEALKRKKGGGCALRE